MIDTRLKSKFALIFETVGFEILMLLLQPGTWSNFLTGEME